MFYFKSTATLILLLIYLLPYAVVAKTLEDRIKENILSLAKDLPKDVGRGVQLTHLSLEDSPVSYNGEYKKVVNWTFKYQLEDRYSEKFKIAQLERISTIVTSCHLPLTSKAIENGFISKYTFEDQNRNILIEFFIGFKECNEFSLAKGSIDSFQVNWTSAHKKILPVRLDEFTELIHISAKGKIISYITRLPTFSIAELNAEAPDFLSQHSQKSFCNSPDLQVLFSLDFASNNLFVDKNREEIVLAKTAPSDCD